MKGMQQSLFKEFLQQKEKEVPKMGGFLDIGMTPYEVIQSIKKGGYRTDKGELNIGEVLRKMKLSEDDFITWAQQNQPARARVAFPFQTTQSNVNLKRTQQTNDPLGIR